jgi:subtilisin-like proprotein convertase family protein
MPKSRIVPFFALALLLALAAVGSATGEGGPPISPFNPEQNPPEEPVVIGDFRDDLDRPMWLVPDGGVRLENRDIHPESAHPLPAVGEGFYIFTTRAITRAERDELASYGLRYLGVMWRHCYAMQWLGGDELLARSKMIGAPWIRGTTAGKAQDRVMREVLPHLVAAAGEPIAELPAQLAIHFWPWTSAGEVRELLGVATEGLLLPTDDGERIGEEIAFLLEAPAGRLHKLASSPLVSAISFDWPKSIANSASRALAKANTIINTPFSLSGLGVVVGEWDGGAVDAAHQDFGGRVTVKEPGNSSTHATHVSGTIIGSGLGNANARGYATNATLISYNFSGNVPNERRQAKHEHYHEHDNHSWGSGGSGGYGGYNNTARDFDTDSRDTMALAIKSAGNDGQQSTVIVQTPQGNYGYNSIDGTSGGKNIIVVGAAQDNGDLSSFSARGPTNDGRIKPDVVANGQGLLSTYPNNTYSSISGTSMSAPSTTGVVTLLAEYHKQLHGGERWAPDVARTVMMHTCEDVFHPGPDFRFGWGLVDATAGHELLTADHASGRKRIVRGSLREGEFEEMTVVVPAGMPVLKVTVSWLDAFAGGTAAKRLIHDLDAKLISPSGTDFFPWTLDAANPHDFAVQGWPNTHDNIEQILVNNPEAGNWTLRVTGTSITDPDLNVQGFVVVSDANIEKERIRVVGLSPAAQELSIPDNGSTLIEFNVAQNLLAANLRAYVGIRHQRRGDIRITLENPDGLLAEIESPNTSTRRDLYAIYPDLRSYNDDVLPFVGEKIQGTWRMRIYDTNPNNTGVVYYAILEIDAGDLPNAPPISNAGNDQTVPPGTNVVLSGSNSFDPDGDPLTYQWAQSLGPQVVITNSSNAIASFIAPDSSATILLRFRLRVTDPSGEFNDSFVDVTVVRPSPRITTVTPNPGYPGATVTINGSWLSGSKITIDGVEQVIESATDTAVKFRVSTTTLLGAGQALLATNDVGSDAVPFDIQEPPSGSVIIDGGDGGGGGGCSISAGGANWRLLGLFGLIGCVALIRRRRALSS